MKIQMAGSPQLVITLSWGTWGTHQVPGSRLMKSLTGLNKTAHWAEWCNEPEPEGRPGTFHSGPSHCRWSWGQTVLVTRPGSEGALKVDEGWECKKANSQAGVRSPDPVLPAASCGHKQMGRKGNLALTSPHTESQFLETETQMWKVKG